MNVIQGCNCCGGDCNVFYDGFDRSFLNVSSPVVYTGNTGAFSIVSSQLNCTTSDRYIVASGMPSFPNGQYYGFDAGAAATAIDLIVNWRDTNNYDFARWAVGQPLELYERISGSNTLKATHSVRNCAPGPFGVARFGTYMAALYYHGGSDYAYLAAHDMATFDTGSTVGVRLESGTLRVDGSTLWQHGGTCRAFETRCMTCDLVDTESIQITAILAGATGDGASLNGTYTLDFMGTYDMEGLDASAGAEYNQYFINQMRSCWWRYTSGSITITAFITANLDGSGVRQLLLGFSNSSPVTGVNYVLQDSSDFYPCTSNTYSLAKVGSDPLYPSTASFEIVP